MYLFPLTSFAGSSLLKDRMETSVSMGDHCFKQNTKYERTRNKLKIIITVHNSQIKVDRFTPTGLIFSFAYNSFIHLFKKKKTK